MLEDGGLLCWGSAGSGELGRGEFGPYDVDVIGDDETPDSLDPIALGDTAVAVELGCMHVCALKTSANLRCWGYADAGALGVGQDTGNIGDNEDPSYWGPVKLL